MSRDLAVIGNFGQGNFGDDLLAVQVLQVVSRAASLSRVVVSGPSKGYLERWFPGVACQPLEQMFSGAESHIGSVIFGGGGQFFSFPPSNLANRWGWSRSTAHRFWRSIDFEGLHQLRGYAYCVGIGPLSGLGAWLMTRKVLCRVEEISVRDLRSRAYLTGMAIGRGRVVADPAIALIHGAAVRAAADGATIGFVVRRWPRPPAIGGFLAALSGAAGILRKAGWRVAFVSFQPSYDAEVVACLEKSGERVLTWNAEEDTVGGFLARLGEFRALVTMRAHGILATSIMGGVCLPVNLEAKLAVTAASCGCGGRLIPLTASATDIARRVEEAIAVGPQPRNWDAELQLIKAEELRLQSWCCSGLPNSSSQGPVSRVQGIR